MNINHAARGSRTRATELLDVLSALLSSDSVTPTAAEELQRRCPKLWAEALVAFRGDAAAARSWLETPSPLFGGKRPVGIVLKVGGRARIARVLERVASRPHEEEPLATVDSKSVGKNAKRGNGNQRQSSSPQL